LKSWSSLVLTENWLIEACGTSVPTAPMAKQLAVSEPSTSAWEQGKARRKPGRMEALAALLGTDVSELLGLEEGECLGDVIARAKKDIARAAKLSPENIKVVIEV